MVLPKDVSLYNKINSFGVIFIFIILLFELGVGIFSLTNTTYTTDKAVYDKYMDEKKVRGILNRTFQTKRRFLNFNIVENFLVKGQKNVVM